MKMKDIVVKSSKWTSTVSLDPDMFENKTYDIYREAAIQFVETQSKQDSFCLSPIIICFDKKDENKTEKHIIFNTYYILLMARMYVKAKEFRRKFKERFGIDTRNEPDEV